MVRETQLIGPAALLRQTAASPMGVCAVAIVDAASSVAAASADEAIMVRMAISRMCNAPRCPRNE